MDTLIKKFAEVKTQAGLVLGTAIGGFSLLFINAAAAAGEIKSTYGREGFGVKDDSALGVTSGAELNVQIINILNTVFILLGFISVLFIIYAGVKLIISKGNESAMKEATKLLQYSFMGFGLIVLSYAIVRYIVSFFADSANSGDVKNVDFQQAK